MPKRCSKGMLKVFLLSLLRYFHKKLEPWIGNHIGADVALTQLSRMDLLVPRRLNLMAKIKDVVFFYVTKLADNNCSLYLKPSNWFDNNTLFTCQVDTALPNKTFRLKRK